MSDKTLYQLNHEVEQLQKQIREAKKEAIEKLIDEVSKQIHEESNKEPLSLRDAKMYLKDFYYRIKDLENIK